MGGAYDRFSDYPSPLMPLVYVLLGMAAPPPSFHDGTQAQIAADARGKDGGGRMTVSRTTLPR